MTRDTIRAEVFVKYVDAEPSNWNQALTDLMAAIANNTGGIVFEGLSYGTSTSTFNASNLVNTSGSSGTAPKAFLNWIIFDRNFVPKDQGGFMRISTAAKETGSDVAHERLFSPDIAITEPGYVYIYLSNEEEDPVEVFWDDFRVEHVKCPVIQMEDYFPFGLGFNSHSREYSLVQDYKYNGKELQNELALQWLDYGARMYLSDVARWAVIDPLSPVLADYSP